MKVFKKYLKQFIDNYDEVISTSNDFRFEEINELSTDSRYLNKGDLFIALKGENFNGNDYINESIFKGASLCISDENEKKKTISVKSTQRFIEDYSIYILNIMKNIKIIGITGTNGKTSTKELTNSILGLKFVTHSTKGNLNNKIGLPLTILNMNEDTEVLILEMGTNDIGEIGKLVDIANPDVATITNIGKGHTLKLKNRETIFKEKFSIVKNFNSSSCFAFNLDDDYMKKEYLRSNLNKISFSIKADSDVRAENLSDDYQTFTLVYKDKKTKINLKAKGINNIYNSLCASSIALFFKMNLEDIKIGIERYQGISNRFNIIDSENNNTIINDTYNANPNSMQSAIEMTSQIFSKKHKIAILGDMLELGDIEQIEHTKIGEILAINKFDQVFIYGNNYINYKNGINEDLEIIEISDHSEITNFIDLKKISNTVILIKGSRGSKMENILKYLYK